MGLEGFFPPPPPPPRVLRALRTAAVTAPAVAPAPVPAPVAPSAMAAPAAVGGAPSQAAAAAPPSAAAAAIAGIDIAGPSLPAPAGSGSGRSAARPAAAAAAAASTDTAVEDTDDTHVQITSAGLSASQTPRSSVFDKKMWTAVSTAEAKYFPRCGCTKSGCVKSGGRGCTCMRADGAEVVTACGANCACASTSKCQLKADGTLALHNVECVQHP